jgi:SAM-dependent methyltransferase
MPSCPNCRCERAAVRYDFGPHKILCCARCELLFLDPWPSEEETRAVYGESYFKNVRFMRGENETLFGYTDYVAERFHKQAHYGLIAREIAASLRHLGRRPRLLEVGCGFGYFLDVAFEEDFEVLGLEFNPYAVERLRRKYAFPIQCGAIETVDFEPASLDAVVMFDVIEHLRDPFAALDRIREILTPNGLLVLTTPDAGTFTSRLLGRRLEDFRRTREHLFFFARKTLRNILNEHGFAVTEMRSIGHTFDLGLLLQRLELYNRPLFRFLGRVAKDLGVASIGVYLNPRTKMIAFARRVDS